MKKKTLRFSTLAFLLLFLASCATLNIGLDSKTKQFLVVQKEVNVALRDYKVFLLAQTPEAQAKLHATYDAPIKLMSAALDAWQQVVEGITLEAGQMEEFLRIKNELILAGWKFFAKEVK
uniref:Lipoprotein n=1 Tax=viral metagenome TaxID=1070528 RepID=A0A6M3X7R7_9ZZZZ